MWNKILESLLEVQSHMTFMSQSVLREFSES